MNPQFEIKSEVLKTSLILENMTSNFLAGLIGVDKSPIETYSFGSRSTALSFNQKILLLIDIGALERNTRIKFLTFMAVRNQFMHNILATSYEVCVRKCLSDEDGKYITKYVKKEEQESDEKHLKRAVDALSNDILKITGELFVTLKTKMGGQMSNELKSLIYDDMLVLVKEQKKIIVEKYVIDKKKAYSADEVVNITFQFLIDFFDKSSRSTMSKHKNRYDEK